MRNHFIVLICFLSSILTAQNDIVGTIKSGGLTREYRLYVPAAYSPNTPVPLVLNLHGYTSNNLEQEYYGDFRAIADTANFLVVHPNGTLDNNGNRFWNSFGGSAAVDDVAFLSNLIDSISAAYNVNPQRIYSTGMSNGGFMSYKLACELNDRIAAIASVTGSMVAPELAACNPQRPVPVMEIHGTADATVPYDGSVAFASIPNVVAAWVGFNNCNPTAQFTAVPNTVPNDFCTAEHYLYTGGDKGSTVEHYKIIGGGHTWPGAIFNVGVTNHDIKASKEIWRFFRQYRLDQLSDATVLSKPQAQWSAYPNPTSDIVTLQSSAQQDVTRIQIYDVSGRLQQTLSPLHVGTIQIETSTWASGLYFLVIEQGGKTERLKLVKEGK